MALVTEEAAIAIPDYWTVNCGIGSLMPQSALAGIVTWGSATVALTKCQVLKSSSE